MVLPLLAGVAASAIGGIFQARSANRAASTQARAATEAARIQQQASERTNQQLSGWREQDIARFSPYAETGGRAQNALAFEMGLGDRPQGYQGFQASPGYQFAMDQGTQAVQGSVAARNGLNSGAAMTELTRFGQGLANQEYGNYYNRLSGLAGTGLAAAGAQGDIGQRYGNAIAGNIINAGQSSAQGVANAANARAAGTVGMGNAFSTAIDNGLGAWQYQQALNAFNPSTTGSMAPMTSPRPMGRPY
jgi:hypothetical protein